MDELNNLLTEILQSLSTTTDKTEIEDSLLDLLIMAYVFGKEDVEESLKTKIDTDVNKMEKSVSKKIKGETWKDRIEKSETLEEIKRIFVTESHRVFCDGQWDSADGIATHKTWVTMQDEKVRDSHWYLDGLTVKIDDYFYTLSGDRAKHPGEFGVASEDINCRCRLKYSKRSEGEEDEG